MLKGTEGQDDRAPAAQATELQYHSIGKGVCLLFPGFPCVTIETLTP